MNGFIISYKAKDSYARTLLNHALYGRMSYKKYRDKKYAYYVPGMLHDVKYRLLTAGKAHVERIDVLDLDVLNIFGDISIEKTDDVPTKLNTGKEHWFAKAKEKELMIRVAKKGKYTKSR